MAAAAAEEQTLVFYKILMLCFLCYSGWQAATGGEWSTDSTQSKTGRRRM